MIFSILIIFFLSSSILGQNYSEYSVEQMDSFLMAIWNNPELEHHEKFSKVTDSLKYYLLIAKENTNDTVYANLLHRVGSLGYYLDLKSQKEYCKEAMTIRKEYFGSRHPDYALSAFYYAILFDDESKTSLIEEAIQIRLETTNESDEEYRYMLYYLSYYYMKKIGNYDKAEKVSLQLMKLNRKYTVSEELATRYIESQGERFFSGFLTDIYNRQNRIEELYYINLEEIDYYLQQKDTSLVLDLIEGMIYSLDNNRNVDDVLVEKLLVRWSKLEPINYCIKQKCSLDYLYDFYQKREKKRSLFCVKKNYCYQKRKT